jgi:hypothetical protein
LSLLPDLRNHLLGNPLKGVSAGVVISSLILGESRKLTSPVGGSVWRTPTSTRMSPAFGEDLVGLFLLSSGFPCQHCRFVLNACSYEQIRSRTFSETSSPRSSLEKVLFLHGPGDLRLSMQATGSPECRTMWISGRTCVALLRVKTPYFPKSRGLIPLVLQAWVFICLAPFCMSTKKAEHLGNSTDR